MAFSKGLFGEVLLFVVFPIGISWKKIMQQQIVESHPFACEGDNVILKNLRGSVFCISFYFMTASNCCFVNGQMK